MEDIPEGKCSSLQCESRRHGLTNGNEYKQTGKWLALTNTTFTLSTKNAAQYEALLRT